MKHEDRKRELAQKYHDNLCDGTAGHYFHSFHTAKTALLEADVIAAARWLLDPVNVCPGAGEIHPRATDRLEQALAALDAHHAKKNGGER